MRILLYKNTKRGLIIFGLAALLAVVSMYLKCKKGAQAKSDKPSLSSQDGKSKTYSELTNMTSME